MGQLLESSVDHSFLTIGKSRQLERGSFDIILQLQKKVKRALYANTSSTN